MNRQATDGAEIRTSGEVVTSEAELDAEVAGVALTITAVVEGSARLDAVEVVREGSEEAT